MKNFKRKPKKDTSTNNENPTLKKKNHLPKIFNPISMKTITLCIMGMAVLFSSALFSQPSVEVGFSSRFQPVLKVQIEKQTSWNNTQFSTQVSLDNFNPIIALQTGYQTQNEGEQSNYRFMVGGFYHTGLCDPKTDLKCQTLRLGGSFRWLICNTSFGVEYTGETLNLSFGYIFNRKN